MKKRILFLFFAILLLSLPVFAEGENDVQSVDITCTAPVNGKKWEEVNEENIAISAILDNQAATLSAPLEYALISCGWYDDSGGTPVEMSPNETFVSGRSYIVKVLFEILVPDLEIDGETALSINGKEATLVMQGSACQMEGRFVCTPGEIAPKVSLNVEGEKEKVYDGEGITLTAAVQKTDGVVYRYEWYRNGELLTGEDKETLTVKNVADSGKYHCKVYARVEADPAETTESTESAAHELAITPHPITIQIENAEKNLFDEDPNFTYTVLGDVYDELEGSPSRDEGEDIGTYTIGQGTLGFPENVAGNYTVEFTNGTLTILNVDDLPFSAAANLADLSYISGENGSKIRIYASKGAMANDAMVKLSPLSENAKEKLSVLSNKEIMKGFAISILSADGKEVSLPKHASLKIHVPLTEEEKDFDLTTLSVGFSTDNASLLEMGTTEDGGITYLTVQIKATGSVAVFEGEKPKAEAPVTTPTSHPHTEKEEGSSTFLWVMIVILTLVSIGAIVFTVVLMQKRKKEFPPKKAVETKPVPPQNAAEKERMRRIAEEINAMPPIPEEMQKDHQNEKAPTEAAETKPKTNVISFEDLEER